MYLPASLYEQIEQSVPIVCVDFVPYRGDGRDRSIGLILRESPHGRVWCHLGGRIWRGETTRNALRRHAQDTLTVDLELPTNPQPAYVYEWFPSDIAPRDGTFYGDDPRKHSVGLSYVVKMDGHPQPRNEALDFRYFTADELPTPLWPGTLGPLRRMSVLEPSIPD